MASDNSVINIEIWSSFGMGSRFGINDNVIENNSKITKDPKIAKDPTAKKNKINKETRPKNFSNISGGSINHVVVVCVISDRVADDSKPDPTRDFSYQVYSS